ncbi:MAG TPA: hypothetical protein VKA85_10165, partial [Candidatus Limnocylindrales bacterium]|nr:hypothetical protein [Candidatus Limnocylindrales bacterium]
MRDLPSVGGAAREVVGRARRRVSPPPVPRLRERLGDRLTSGDLLRLRGRFRGRDGLVAFLAVMGPGLIAGI